MNSAIYSEKKENIKRKYFLDIPIEELAREFPQPESYRLSQICDWIFRKRVFSFMEMTTLPLSFREDLSQRFSLRSLTVTDQKHSHNDQTTKFTFLTRDRKNFTSVFLPHTKYVSACLSTQIGCAWKCAFCASGLVPLERNCSPAEILDQIFWIETLSKQKIQNILFMGMGEPLANYLNTVQSVRWMISSPGLGMNPARITISTTGLAPQIRMLAREKLETNLALSLHAPNDSLRKKIMPVSSRFQIADVLEACKLYQSLNRSDFTIEYILLDQVNDTAPCARELIQLLNSIHFSGPVKINLIPYNPVPTLPFKKPSEKSMTQFFGILKKTRYIVHTRKPQGQDIGAACGQLS